MQQTRKLISSFIYSSDLWCHNHATFQVLLCMAPNFLHQVLVPIQLRTVITRKEPMFPLRLLSMKILSPDHTNTIYLVLVVALWIDPLSILQLPPCSYQTNQPNSSILRRVILIDQLEVYQLLLTKSVLLQACQCGMQVHMPTPHVSSNRHPFIDPRIVNISFK